MMEKYHYQVVSPERIKAFDGLRDRLEKLTRRAEIFGMTINSVVEQSGLRIQKHADEKVFGASLGKLPLAAMAVEFLEPHVPPDLNDARIDRDKLTAAELVENMLKHSDNGSYRILGEALGGPDTINRYYDHKGWNQTRVKTAPNGRAQLAETTASEVLEQLQYLLGPDCDNELADVARQALSEQQVDRYGIRQLKLDDPDVHIFNKTGEYNGDVYDPYIFRHDVGSVLGPKARVSYAVMTSFPYGANLMSNVKKYLSDGVVKQFGAELVDFAGGNRGRRIGVQAVRSVVKRG